jgi:anthranilate phosphoribosyltransferase
MRNIGYVRGMVVYGKDEASGLGMDEISPCGETVVHEFAERDCRDYVIRPEELGIRRIPFEQIAFSGSLEAEAVRFLQVLSGKGHQGCIDFTCLNAGAILYVAGKCHNPADGIEISREALGSGKALSKLRQWVALQDARNGEGTKRLEAVRKGTAEILRWALTGLKNIRILVSGTIILLLYHWGIRLEIHARAGSLLGSGQGGQHGEKYPEGEERGNLRQPFDNVESAIILRRVTAGRKASPPILTLLEIALCIFTFLCEAP